MTVDQMVDKIMRYSHRKENEVFADKSILKVAVAEKKYIFEPERDFHIVEIGDLHSKIYPDSLASFIHEFPEEII
jgi:hypothetical protein